jgi:hypothetical protein
MLRRSLLSRSVPRFLSPALLVLELGTGVGLARTTHYVNAVSGRDDCHPGLAPVPTDLCPFPPEPASVEGPFRTITRLASPWIAGGPLPIVHGILFPPRTGGGQRDQ